MLDVETLILIAALSVAGIACVTDLRARWIPNKLILSGLGVGIGLNLWANGIQGLGSSLAGAAVGLILFLPFFALGGMGGGDVKLMAALGSFVGAGGILKLALAAAVAGGVMALVLALWEGRLLATFKGLGELVAHWFRRGLQRSPVLHLENPATLKIPYAVPVAAGTLFVALSQWGLIWQS